MALLKAFSGRFLLLLRSWVGSLKRAADIRDFFVFGGLAMLWHGLNQQWPWLSYAVCGVILMAIGYLMKGE